MVGSCKTNFGHLEAAAGIAGIAKLVAALGQGAVPPHLHFKTPNPNLDWAQLPLRVNTALEPWPHAAAAVRRAGVSSFGFSGTNAHVVLESAPLPHPTALAEATGLADAKALADAAAGTDSARLHAAAPPEAALRTAASTAADRSATSDRPRHVLALSATTDAALRELAARYIACIERGTDELALPDLCFSANTGRAQLPRRLAVSAGTLAELREALAAFVAGHASPNLRTSGAAGTAGGAGTAHAQVGLLFTGQGAQYSGMGHALDVGSPTFRAAIDECAAVLDPLLPHPLRSLLFGTPGSTDPALLLSRTECAQPALFALEWALAKLWRHWGLQPALLLGHSLGEISAAAVAGVLALPDALRLVAARGRLMQQAAGTMVTLFATAEQAAALALAHGVEIAALNGPTQVVLSGPADAIAAVCAAAEAAGLKHQRLPVAHAFHSAALEPVLDEFEQVVATLPLQPPRLTLISNLTALPADAVLLTSPAYWRRQMREPVRFEASMRCAAAAEVTHWLEIGPAPVLAGMAARFVELPAERWLPSLRPQADEWTVLLAALEQLWVDGAEIDWQAFDADHPRRRVAVPTMPWQRRRHWFDLPEEVAAAPATAAPSSHDALHTWRSIEAALSRASDQGPIGTELAGYSARWACLERLTVAASMATLRDAGCFMQAGERATASEVAARLGTAATYRHLLQRWLERLATCGHLQRDAACAETFIATAPLPDPQLAERWQDAEQQLAGNAALLAYLKHCVGLLGAVLGGRESALETLFPGGSYELAEGLYERSATARYLNGLAATALQAMVASRPGHAWRVLEAGAGTGGTSSALLPLMPERAAYWFTDVTGVFLERAQRKFATCPALRVATFDLETDPALQGFAEGGFDLVLAANAVHAVRDLRATLQRLRRLLAPGGLLMLMEATEHLAWFDISTGLIEGWQAFDDDLRTDQPLLAPEQWVQALGEAGFVQAQAWPPAGSPGAMLAAHVVVARVAGEVHAARSTDGAAAFDTPGSTLPAGDAGITPSAHTAEQAAAVLRARLRDALPDERTEALRDLVRERVMAILRLAPDQAPGPDDRLLDLGFDSLMAVQLRGQLGVALGLAKPLPATLLFDHPTVAAMARELLARLVLEVPAAPGASPPPSAAPLARSAAATTAAAAAAPATTPATTPAAPPTARAAEVAAMSDEEVEALLLQRLGP